MSSVGWMVVALGDLVGWLVGWSVGVDGGIDGLKNRLISVMSNTSDGCFWSDVVVGWSGDVLDASASIWLEWVQIKRNSSKKIFKKSN